MSWYSCRVRATSSGQPSVANCDAATRDASVSPAARFFHKMTCYDSKTTSAHASITKPPISSPFPQKPSTVPTVSYHHNSQCRNFYNWEHTFWDVVLCSLVKKYQHFKQLVVFMTEEEAMP